MYHKIAYNNIKLPNVANINYNCKFIKYITKYILKFAALYIYVTALMCVYTYIIIIAKS